MKSGRKITKILLLIAFLSACSPEARLNTLVFFFDGVPAPATDTMVPPSDTPAFSFLSENDSSPAMQQTMYSYHEPYQEKHCTACHDANAVGSLVQNEPELCYACHQDFNTRYEALHGPVDAGFCSSCHDPHMSRGRSLLISQGNELCSICHQSEEVSQPLEHADIGKELCITCHDPHAKKIFRQKPKPIPLER